MTTTVPAPAADGTPTEADILRAAAAWAWFPRGSEHVRGDLLLVRYPERFGAASAARR